MNTSLTMIMILLISVLALNIEASGKKYITHCKPKGVSILEFRTDGGKSGGHNASKRIRMVEERLKELRYNPGKVDGKTDTHFECALMGFQRMNGMEPNFRIDLPIIEALKHPAQPKPAQVHDGLHAEADLSRQILTLYSGGEIVRIMPISSGSGKTFEEAGDGMHIAKTPTGDFTFFAHIYGLHKSHLGELFNPVYFHKDGYAVHGDLLVPPHPASHGCLRITIEDSKWFVKEVPLHTPILVSGKALPTSRR